VDYRDTLLDVGYNYLRYLEDEAMIAEVERRGAWRRG
jgi:hypothetical protein